MPRGQKKTRTVQEDLTQLLAEETLLHILKELPVRTLFAAGQVDQRWRRVSRDARLWRDARLGGDQLGCKTRNAVRNVACVLRMAPCLRALSLDNSFCGPHMLRAVRESQCQIRELHLEYCEEEPWCRELLARQSGSLVKLSLHEMTSAVVPALESLGQLQHLAFKSTSESVRAPSAASKLKHLVSLRVERCNYWFLKQLLKDNGLTLKELSLGTIWSKWIYASVAKSCKHLRKLELSTQYWRFRQKLHLQHLKNLEGLSEIVLHVGCSSWDARNPVTLESFPTQIYFLTIVFSSEHPYIQGLVAHCQALAKELPAFPDLEKVVLVFDEWDLVSADLQGAVRRAVPPGATCEFADSL